MINEEMKAPEMPGFEICSYTEWESADLKDKAHVYISGEGATYYKRIKPKEKTLREVFMESSKRNGWSNTIVDNTIGDFADYIEENYVKKEGEMGMFDYVDYECDCPNCGEKVTGFQSKDFLCELLTIKPWEVSSFYTDCRHCKAWVEFSRKNYKTKKHVSPHEPIGWKEEFGIKEE